MKEQYMLLASDYKPFFFSTVHIGVFYLSSWT